MTGDYLMRAPGDRVTKISLNPAVLTRLDRRVSHDSTIRQVIFAEWFVQLCQRHGAARFSFLSLRGWRGRGEMAMVLVRQLLLLAMRIHDCNTFEL